MGPTHPEGVVRRSRSDAENSTSAPTARMQKVSSFGCVQARPHRAPDSLLLTSAQPGLEPPNPLAQPWLGLAQQGHLHTDLAAGRGVPRLPRQQEAILQCRHCQPCCQPLAVYCHRPSSGHVSTSLGRLPSPVSSASSRSPAIVGIARELADGAKTKLEISDPENLSGEIRPGC